MRANPSICRCPIAHILIKHYLKPLRYLGASATDCQWLMSISRLNDSNVPRIREPVNGRKANIDVISVIHLTKNALRRLRTLGTGLSMTSRHVSAQLLQKCSRNQRQSLRRQAAVAATKETRSDS